MLLKHSSLDRKETEKKLKSITVLNCSGEEKEMCKAMGSTFLVRQQKSFQVVSSLISGRKLQICAGTQDILRTKFSM